MLLIFVICTYISVSIIGIRKGCLSRLSSRIIGYTGGHHKMDESVKHVLGCLLEQESEYYLYGYHLSLK